MEVVCLMASKVHWTNAGAGNYDLNLNRHKAMAQL